MSASFDLDAYFERIGYSGHRKPTLATLEEIHLRHVESIAFENLNPLLRWPVLLDSASLQKKLVRDGRGGYCFEHNLLLSHALTTLGYHVTGLAARVLWNAPETAIVPRTHMLLRIELDGRPYLADTGFGGLTLTGPIRLEPDTVLSTPHEPFRLLPDGESFVMQAEIQGAWTSLYRFDLQRQLLPDYEVANWYVSTHPASHFLHGLIAARPATGCRYALRNSEFAVHHLGGTTERRILTTAAELRQTLIETFRIALPDTAELTAALERVAAPAGRS